MEKTFMEAMDFRHACKIFDETKKISSDDLNFILEAGRKSPSYVVFFKPIERQ